MIITKTQLKLLKFYAKYETEPLTVLKLIRAFLLAWVLLALIATASTFFIWSGWPVVAWLYIGVAFGAFLRDVGRIISLFLTWPALHEIIRWDRVKELIRETEGEWI